MPSRPPFEFPSRPVSIREALSLQEHIETFDYTAPMIGLAAEETGQAGDAKAVVGLYLGFGGGVHFSGFNPDSQEWESVSVLSSQDVPETAAMQSAVGELMEWVADQYPGEELVVYEKGDLQAN